MRSTLRCFTRSMMLGLIVLTTIFAWAGAASAQFLPPPSGSQFTLEGCRNTGQIPLYTNPGGPAPLICFDPAYTTGNLQKGWNELDLVPFRLTAKAGASGSYNVFIGADFSLDATKPCGTGAPGTTACGYDVITAPVVNPSLSDNGGLNCSVSASAQFELAGITGGTASTALRELTINQPAGSTCVFDWDQRLALGAHLFPGSSLQAYMFQSDVTTSSSTVGKKTVPIPVKAILPQELSKTMGASQGSDHTWTISKSTDNASLDIPDTCSTGTSPLAKQLHITIAWTKLAAAPGGPVTITTTISATNPAARTITVNVTDKIYRGSDQSTPAIDTATGTTDVPPNSTTVVLTHTFEDSSPAGNTYNDVADATYTDLLTGVPVPGNTEATASATVQNTGPVANATATIVDVETISDPNSALVFTVDAVNDPSGGFFDGYTPGSNVPVTTVTYHSGTLSSASLDTDSGKIVFTKSVAVGKAGTVVANGSFDDTATLTGSGTPAFTAEATLHMAISAEAQAALTIKKTIDVLPAGSPAQTFTFNVAGTATSNFTSTQSLVFNPGDTSHSVTLSNLIPDTYTATEQDPGVAWTITSSNPQSFNFTGIGSVAICTGELDFTNQLAGKALTVSKTANSTFTRTFNWQITKSVDKTTVTTNPGGTATFNYTVNVSTTGSVDSAWQATGVITVNNPNFFAVAGVNVTDAVDNGGTCSVTGGSNATIPANSSSTFNYTCTYASAPTAATGTNTATAAWTAANAHTLTDGSATGTAGVNFTTPTTNVNKTVTVTDTFQGTTITLGTVTAPAPPPGVDFKYSHTVTAPSGGCTGQLTNTAIIVETSQQAQQNVQVCGFSGELAPTQTTCSQFLTSTNLQQSGINYTVSGGVITQSLNPGVFFYFTKIVPTSAGNQTIAVTESNSGGPGNYNFATQQVQLFDSSCNSLTFSLGGNGSTLVTLSRALQKGNLYIVAVKYSAKSIAGQLAPSTDPVFYSYQTLLNGVLVDANFNAFILTKGPVGTF